MESTAPRPLVICAGIGRDLSARGLFRHCHRRQPHVGVAGMIVALDAFGGDGQCGRHRRDGASRGRRAQRRPTRWMPSATPPGGDQGLRDRLGRPRRSRAVCSVYGEYQLLHRQQRELSVLSKALDLPSFSLTDPWVWSASSSAAVAVPVRGMAMTAVGRAAARGRRSASPNPRNGPASMLGTQKPDYGPRRRHADPRRSRDDPAFASPGALARRCCFCWCVGLPVHGGLNALGAMLLGVIVTGLFVRPR